MLCKQHSFLSLFAMNSLLECVSIVSFKQKLLEKITFLSNLLKEYEKQNLHEANLEEFGASGVLFATALSPVTRIAYYFSNYIICLPS